MELLYCSLICYSILHEVMLHKNLRKLWLELFLYGKRWSLIPPGRGQSWWRVLGATSPQSALCPRFGFCSLDKLELESPASSTLSSLYSEATSPVRPSLAAPPPASPNRWAHATTITQTAIFKVPSSTPCAALAQKGYSNGENHNKSGPIDNCSYIKGELISLVSKLTNQISSTRFQLLVWWLFNKMT